MEHVLNAGRGEAFCLTPSILDIVSDVELRTFPQEFENRERVVCRSHNSFRSKALSSMNRCKERAKAFCALKRAAFMS
ncbi:MAG: hypothetical protein LUP99_00150, partial [Methanomicrobiales archaeon]|nr:hypothetical protein [Methanomicrobiales archaeon]